jgi:hypothetical protein
MSQRTERNVTSPSLNPTWSPVDTEVRRSREPSAIFRDLRVKGFAADEAGNLTAHLNGIRPVEGGWKVGEIDRLLFLRHLVRRGSDHAPAAS